MKKVMESVAIIGVDGLKVSEVEVVYKTHVKASSRPTVTQSKEVYELLKRNWDAAKIELVEQFKILLLNRANKALGICELSTGGISGTVADPKIIFIAALKAAASNIILAHNHPSGNLTPSRNDIDLTRKIKEVGQLLEITVLDHIILSSEGFYSLADEGLM